MEEVTNNAAVITQEQTPQQTSPLDAQQSAISTQQQADVTAQQTAQINDTNAAVADLAATSNAIPLGNYAGNFSTDRYGNYASAIGDIYGQQANIITNSYTDAYQKEYEELSNYAANIEDQYQTAQNQMEQQKAQDIRNQTLASTYAGTSSGAKNYEQVALRNQYAQQQATLSQQRVAAKAAADKAVIDLKANYQSKLRDALTNNSLQYASSIFSLMQNEDSYKDTMAATMAQYGIFDGYKDLGYTDAQIASMKINFCFSNPYAAKALGYLDELVATGKYTAKEIYELTGLKVTGYGTKTGSGSANGVKGPEEFNSFEDYHKYISSLNISDDKKHALLYTTAEKEGILGEPYVKTALDVFDGKSKPAVTNVDSNKSNDTNNSKAFALKNPSLIGE